MKCGKCKKENSHAVVRYGRDATCFQCFNGIRRIVGEDIVMPDTRPLYAILAPSSPDRPRYVASDGRVTDPGITTDAAEALTFMREAEAQAHAEKLTALTGLRVVPLPIPEPKATKNIVFKELRGLGRQSDIGRNAAEGYALAPANARPVDVGYSYVGEVPKKRKRIIGVWFEFIGDEESEGVKHHFVVVQGAGRFGYGTRREAVHVGTIYHRNRVPQWALNVFWLKPVYFRTVDKGKPEPAFDGEFHSMRERNAIDLYLGPDWNPDPFKRYIEADKKPEQLTACYIVPVRARGYIVCNGCGRGKIHIPRSEAPELTECPECKLRRFILRQPPKGFFVTNHPIYVPKEAVLSPSEAQDPTESTPGQSNAASGPENKVQRSDNEAPEGGNRFMEAIKTSLVPEGTPDSNVFLHTTVVRPDIVKDDRYSFPCPQCKKTMLVTTLVQGAEPGIQTACYQCGAKVLARHSGNYMDSTLLVGYVEIKK